MECAAGNELEIELELARYMISRVSRGSIRRFTLFFYEYHYSPHKLHIMRAGDQKLMINILEWPKRHGLDLPPP